MFENIECEWPLFFILLQLDALIEGNIIKAKEYKEKLDKILPESEDGLRRVPELFYVPADKVHVLSRLFYMYVHTCTCIRTCLYMQYSISKQSHVLV